MRRLLLLAGLLVLVPLAGWGADGDACDSTQWDGGFGGGMVRAVQCVVVCDDKSGNDICGDGFYEMNRNMFDNLVFRIWHDNGGCGVGGLDITTQTSESSGATVVGSGSLSVTTDGNQMLIRVSDPVNEEDVVMNSLSFELTNMTCGGTVDVMMIGYEVGR